MERLGGTATVKQVAEAVSGRLEIVREELRAMSGFGLIFMTKGAGGRYTVSLTKRKAERRETAAVAKTRTVVNASSSDTYDGSDLHPIPGLPHSRMVAFSLPSRVGNRRYHKDGRVEVIE
ncbi:MAG: hypothetical protein JHC40_01075 [Burkholderiales bacterium]|nr:hypothetical protein [Burkholderiales bacterium]